MLFGSSFTQKYTAIMSVPALHVHHSLSIPEYSLLYHTDDIERAFSVPASFKQNDHLISSAEDSLAVIEDAYNQLQATVKRLAGHYRRLSKHIDQQKAYIVPSPIRRLPTELLSLIFSYACQSFERDDYRTPLSISVTCFKWRSIAISTPALWTYIFVGPVGANSEGHKRLTLYMDRAKGLPISLKWVVDRSQWIGPDDDVPDDDPIYDDLQYEHDDLMKEILGTHNSWRTAEFHGLEDMDQESFHFTVDDAYDSQLPLLENLTWSGWDPSDVAPNFPTAFARARKLRTFSLLSHAGFDRWGQKYIPWQQIESITIQHWNTGVASTLLDRGFVEGNKRTLILKGPLTAESTSHPVQYLTRLVLQPKFFDLPLITILSSIRLSSLEKLTLEDSAREYRSSSARDWYISVLTGVLDMLKRSAYSLRVLKMVFSEVPREPSCNSALILWPEEPLPAWRSLLDCLEHIPSLQSLIVIESPIRPPLLTSSFISAINSQRLLPALTSAEFVWRDSDSLPEDEVVRFLESRSGMDGFKKLDSVVLGVREGGEVHSRVLDSMKLLRSCGIRASLW